MSSRGTKYWSTGAIPLIAPDLLGDIISTASDIAIVINDMGQILSVLVNPNHNSFGKLDHWEGCDIREVLTTDSIPKLESQLVLFSEGSGTNRPVEINHRDATDLTFPVRYSFHRIGPDGALLMLGRDLRHIAEMQQQLIEAQLTLERDYEHQRETGTRMRVLMETTRDAVIFVALGSGKILDINGPAAQLMGGSVSDLSGTPFSALFEGGRNDAFLDGLMQMALSEAGGETFLNAAKTKRSLRAHVTLFRAAGERMLICRLDPTDDAPNVADETSTALAQLFDQGSDAIVMTDRAGTIATANSAFLSMVDVAQAASLKGRSFSDFLVRGIVDLKVLTENVMRNGQMRLYATRLQSEFGSDMSVEITATQLTDPSHPGIAFVIRDATRLENLRGATVGVSDDGMRSARELVGSATLKDIVSETTDVVEKMCIETAVELTGNNRVAAAEMLGLSRQSLYVKLRKYGLLARND